MTPINRRDGLADDDGRPTEVSDEGDDVTARRRTAVVVPAEAVVATTADVEVGDAVTRVHQLWGEEAVGVPAVPHPVGQDDERLMQLATAVKPPSPEHHGPIGSRA